MELNLGKKLFNLNQEINKINYTKNIYIVKDYLPEWDMKNQLIIKLSNDKLLVSGNFININFWYELKQDCFLYIFYQAENIIIPNEYFKSIFPKDLHHKLIIYQTLLKLPSKILYYKISENIKHVEEVFKRKYNLKKLENKENENEPCIFFGVYNLKDLNNIIEHKGEKHIIFGGSDLDTNLVHTNIIIPELVKYILNDKNNNKFYFISNNLQKRGKNLIINKMLYKINGILIDLNLTNDLWENNLENLKKSNTIFVYDGFKKKGHLYNLELIDKIYNKLKNKYNFIFSSDLNLSNDEMINIYKKCFIGLRLTKKDGNANSVLEMGKLNIPVIFNGENVNSINYLDFDDIINKINYWKNLVNKIDFFN